LPAQIVDDLTLAFVPHTPHGRASVDVLMSSQEVKLVNSVDVVIVALSTIAADNPYVATALGIAEDARDEGKQLVVVCTDTSVLRATAASIFGVSILDAIVASTTKEILDSLASWFADTKSDLKLAFAANFEWMRRHIAKEAISATAMQNGAIGVVVFIPGADLPVMTLNQAKMILQIAAAYGQPMNKERIKELAMVVGGGFALRYVARTAIGFVPVLGWAIKGVIGYTGTLAMGNAALEYFERGGSPEGLAAKLQEVREGLVKNAEKGQKALPAARAKLRLPKGPSSSKNPLAKKEKALKKPRTDKDKSGYHKLA